MGFLDRFKKKPKVEDTENLKDLIDSLSEDNTSSESSKRVQINSDFLKSAAEKYREMLSEEASGKTTTQKFSTGYLDPSVAMIMNARSTKMGRKDIIKCKNPRCITSTERGLRHICVLKDKQNAKYRCKYCDSEV